MWSPRFPAIFFFLILELTPQPGVSQISHLFKSCQDCKGRLLTDEQLTENFYITLVQKANYSNCPHHVKFTLPRLTACAENSKALVRNITKCIDQGRTPCLPASANKQDFSKGSNDKPTTITQESTTSTDKTVPFLKLSTQTWKGGTLKPSEPPTAGPATPQNILETTIGLTTTAPDSGQNNDLLHGNEPPTEKDDTKGKMKHMTIAIISLILIVLIMMSVGMYVWCRRTRLTECRNHCVEESVSYQRTPLEEQTE